MTFNDIDNQSFTVLRRGASEKLLILLAKIRTAVPKQSAGFLRGVRNGIVNHTVSDIEQRNKLGFFQLYVVCGKDIRFIHQIQDSFDVIGDLRDKFFGVWGIDDVGQSIHAIQNTVRVKGRDDEQFVQHETIFIKKGLIHVKRQKAVRIGTVDIFIELQRARFVKDNAVFRCVEVFFIIVGNRDVRME